MSKIKISELIARHEHKLNPRINERRPELRTVDMEGNYTCTWCSPEDVFIAKDYPMALHQQIHYEDEALAELERVQARRD